MQIETVSDETLTNVKWPISKLAPPQFDSVNGVWLYATMIVDASETAACAQAFTRYKRAHPGFNYRSKRENDKHRFWRIS